MNPSHRPAIQLGIIAAVLLGATFICYGLYAGARNDFQTALLDLNQCRKMADHIRQLSKKPAMAGDSKSRPDDQIAQRSQIAAQKAHIPPGSLEEITPGQPARVGKTDYKEQPTQLVFNDITMTHVVAFLMNLNDDGRDDLRVRSLCLSAPPDHDVGNRWNVQVTLSYLIYDPEAGSSGLESVSQR